MFTEPQLRNLTDQELMRLLPHDSPEVSELVRRMDEMRGRMRLLGDVVDSIKAKMDATEKRYERNSRQSL